MLQAQSKYAPQWSTPYTPERVYSVRKVKKTTRKVNQKRKTLVKGGIILFSYSLLLVFLCIKSATLGYQINNLENDIKQLETSNKSIEFQIAQKCSLDKIETVAVNDLGMYKPDIDKAINVEVQKEPVKVASISSNSNTKKVGQNVLHSIYTNLSRLAQNN